MTRKQAIAEGINVGDKISVNGFKPNWDWFEKEFSVHCLYDTHMILVNKQGKYVLKSGNLSKFGSKRRSAMDCGVEKITH